MEPFDPHLPADDPADLDAIDRKIEEAEALDRQARRSQFEVRLRVAEEERRRLLLVLEIARSLSRIDRVEDLLERVLEHALAISGMDRAYILQRREDGTIATTASRVRTNFEAGGDALEEISHTILERVLARGEVAYVSDAFNDPAFMALKSVRDLSLRTVVCVPLTGPSGVFGALYMDSQSAAGLLGDEGLRMVEAFAAQAGIILEAAAHRQELREVAESLETENKNLKEVLEERTRFDKLLGRSASMQRVFTVLGRVAEKPVTILIQGETGTGKDLVARALHFNGPRRERNFISVNCAAIPDALLESELFGYRKGAFTGAERDHVGLVEAADGGTLFLDEIGDLSLHLQAKLLHLLQENEVRRLGESHDRKVDVRFIAATHRNLVAEVERRTFREDLFYRLNVITVTLPALRERREDIMLLADHFLEEERRKMGRPGMRFSKASRMALLDHSWPGNVRELLAAVMRAAALTDSEIIEPQDLFPETPRSTEWVPSGGRSLKESLELAERGAILGALQAAERNVSRAARSLGVSRQHLHTRIRRLDLKEKY